MVVVDGNNDEPPAAHGYPVSVCCLVLRLVLQGISLRAVPRALAIMGDAFGWSLPIPHWTTGRLWLLRLGHAVLTAPLPKADDWAWLIDHSVQIGQEKCLVILGIRLQDLPKPGDCLAHDDMKLIALAPRKSWTAQEVDDQLEAASQRTGVPRVIVNDHGRDILSGVSSFQERHTETLDVYDGKHKAACLLKGRLEKNPRWQEFQRQTAQTTRGVHQTELAFLAPPAAKPKARFMNLEPTLQWAKNVLGVLREPPPVVRERVNSERLQEKLGWLSEYAPDLEEWSEWQRLANATVDFVNRQGLYRGAAKMLWTELRREQLHDSSKGLAKELVVYVAKQASQARVGERLPGSTEVLESCFGRFKQLEKQQARGGFTSLVLGFGALLAKTTTEAINNAMEHSHTKEIAAWCKETLGTTIFAQRKLAFASGEGATKTR